MTTSESLPPTAAPGRRTVVAAVGAAGLAVALSACGSSDDSSSSDTSNTQAGANASGGGSGASASTGSGGGTALAKTTDIPEGGGKIFKDQSVVVTQPASGTYKAFSTRCPHAGCAVSSISNGVIVCPCHGSEFSVTDGSVKKGPATTGLTAANVTVSGDSITLA